MAAGCRPRRTRRAAAAGFGMSPSGESQARTPDSGALPNMPSLTLPARASPSIAAENSSVSAIGCSILAFQKTLLPLTVPSKISVEPPSPPKVPVSVPPSALSVATASRVPIGVSIMTFQTPSTDMRRSSSNVAVTTGRDNYLIFGSGTIAMVRSRRRAKDSATTPPTPPGRRRSRPQTPSASRSPSAALFGAPGDATRARVGRPDDERGRGADRREDPGSPALERAAVGTGPGEVSSRVGLGVEGPDRAEGRVAVPDHVELVLSFRTEGKIEISRARGPGPDLLLGPLFFFPEPPIRRHVDFPGELVDHDADRLGHQIAEDLLGFDPLVDDAADIVEFEPVHVVVELGHGEDQALVEEPPDQPLALDLGRALARSVSLDGGLGLGPGPAAAGDPDLERYDLAQFGGKHGEDHPRIARPRRSPEPGHPRFGRFGRRRLRASGRGGGLGTGGGLRDHRLFSRRRLGRLFPLNLLPDRFGVSAARQDHRHLGHFVEHAQLPLPPLPPRIARTLVRPIATRIGRGGAAGSGMGRVGRNL